MSFSIYSNEVKREAEMFGITELQAYRNVNARRDFNNRRGDKRSYSRIGVNTSTHVLGPGMQK